MNNSIFHTAIPHLHIRIKIHCYDMKKMLSLSFRYLYNLLCSRFLSHNFQTRIFYIHYMISMNLSKLCPLVWTIFFMESTASFFRYNDEFFSTASFSLLRLEYQIFKFFSISYSSVRTQSKWKSFKKNFKILQIIQFEPWTSFSTPCTQTSLMNHDDLIPRTSKLHVRGKN